MPCLWVLSWPADFVRRGSVRVRGQRLSLFRFAVALADRNGTSSGGATSNPEPPPALLLVEFVSFFTLPSVSRFAPTEPATAAESPFHNLLGFSDLRLRPAVLNRSRANSC